MELTNWGLIPTALGQATVKDINQNFPVHCIVLYYIAKVQVFVRVFSILIWIFLCHYTMLYFIWDLSFFSVIVNKTPHGVVV